MTNKLNFQQKWENKVDRLFGDTETHKVTTEEYINVTDFSENYYCECEVY